MPRIGSARVQTTTGTVTFPAPAPSQKIPLTGYAVQTPVEGINLYDNLYQVAGEVTLVLRSLIVGHGLRLIAHDGILYLNIQEDALPSGPTGWTGPTGPTGPPITGPTGSLGPTGPSFYDIIGFWRGPLPSDTLPMHYFQFARAVSLPSSLTGSSATCIIAPSDGAVSMALKKNGMSVGTMDFAEGNRTGSFTFNSTVNFAAGDVWEVYPPNPSDSTFAGLSWTIVANVL